MALYVNNWHFFGNLYIYIVYYSSKRFFKKNGRYKPQMLDCVLTASVCKINSRNLTYDQAQICLIWSLPIICPDPFISV